MNVFSCWILFTYSHFQHWTNSCYANNKIAHANVFLFYTLAMFGFLFI